MGKVGFIISSVLAVVVLFAAITPLPVHAASNAAIFSAAVADFCTDKNGNNIGNGKATGSVICDTRNSGGDIGKDKFATSLVNTLFMIFGALAVIMIIYGGIRYATSNGDPGNVKTAKNTILYSVIGLVVTLMSYGIVNFILDRL